MAERRVRDMEAAGVVSFCLGFLWGMAAIIAIAGLIGLKRHVDVPLGDGRPADCWVYDHG